VSGRDELLAHLGGGVTTVCRTWGVARADGVRLGFTDHDRDLAFEGWVFRAETGVTSGVVSRTTGLSVDNVEALGALSDAAVTEADIEAGRYDAAAVTGWLVNWRDVGQRMVLFRGELGEIARAGGAFRADLRGLTERAAQPKGRVYQGLCGAVLGDGACGVDLSASAYRVETTVAAVAGTVVLRVGALAGYAEGWFAGGRLTVLGGSAAGLVAHVKADRAVPGGREIELWQGLRADLGPGDAIRLEAGCDKRVGTCREKFGNLLNFRGFPHVPGDDWLTSYPKRSGRNDGARLPRAGAG